MRKITLPDWVKKLPDNARLNSKEVIVMFGYPASASVSRLLQRGSLPAPSARGKGFTNDNHQWTVADLKKYERECQNCLLSITKHKCGNVSVRCNLKN